MVGFEAVGSSSHRESKQELHASLLHAGGESKEVNDSTMVRAAVMVVVGGGGKQDLCGDDAPWIDGSESKEELIQTHTLAKPSTMFMAMSKDELLEPPSEKNALGKSSSKYNDEINGQDEKLTHDAADDNKSSTTTTSTPISKDSPLAPTANAYKNTSPTSVAAFSLKRLESFRFPLRKSPIEKSSMARPRLHQCHHHSHHHSLPYNTATATYAHHLSKTAIDAHHQPLIASDLVREVHGSISRSNSSSSAVSTTTPASSAFVLRNDTEPRQSLLDDAIGTSFSPTTPQGGNESGAGGSSRRHDPRWVSERYRRQMGQQRLLRRSESCSNISHHRPSLSFNSSKKALLSLQARRVNKPDAKVHLLPEILTTATTSPALSSGPAVSEDDGPHSGLETPVATAVLLDTVLRNATPCALICEPPAFASASVAKFVAPAGMASATVDYPHDNTDYQLRVSEQDRVVVDSILTELGATEPFPSQTKTAGDDDVVVSSKTLVPAFVDATKFDQETDSTTTVAAAEVSEFTPKETPAPLPETNLPTALTAFKIESGPVIDAGEIKRFVKRSHALQELETTEQSYVNDLDILVHVSCQLCSCHC